MRKDILLPGVAVAGGAAGFLLRRWELSTAFEPDTGLPVAVFAQGSGQDLFEGFYDNTQVYHKLAGLLGVK